MSSDPQIRLSAYRSFLAAIGDGVRPRRALLGVCLVSSGDAHRSLVSSTGQLPTRISANSPSHGEPFRGPTHSRQPAMLHSCPVAPPRPSPGGMALPTRTNTLPQPACASWAFRSPLGDLERNDLTSAESLAGLRYGPGPIGQNRSIQRAVMTGCAGSARSRMSLNQPSPVWPYLGILVGLFAIAVSAPRGWETLARRESIQTFLDRRPPTA